MYYTHQGMSDEEELAHIMNYVLNANKSRTLAWNRAERSYMDVTSPVAVRSMMMDCKDAVVSLRDASLSVCWVVDVHPRSPQPLPPLQTSSYSGRRGWHIVSFL